MWQKYMIIFILTGTGRSTADMTPTERKAHHQKMGSMLRGIGEALNPQPTPQHHNHTHSTTII